MNKHIKTTQRTFVPAEGIVTVSLLRPKTKRDKELRLAILDIREKARFVPYMERRGLLQQGHELMQELIASCMVRQSVQKNIVCISGLTAITKALTSNLTSLNEIEINYCAVGTGTTTPAASDTQLTTESFRNAVNSLNYADNVMYAGMFIDYTENSGTYYEGGLFINGSATANSGTLLNHVLLESPTGIAKTTSDLLTISYQITFTSV